MAINHTARYNFFGPLNDYIEYDDLSEYPDECYLVTLTGPQIHAILIMVDLWESYRLWSMPHKSRWDGTLTAKWDTIQDFVADTRESLMAGCDITSVITALNEIRDAINNQNPALDVGQTSNDLLDQMATAQGISTEWLAVKAGLSLLFPSSEIPISIGVDVLRGLLANANNTEAEIFDIAKQLGSVASLPD